MKYQILLQHQGENATTAHDPVTEVLAVVGDQVTARSSGEKTYTVSLTERHTCCMNSGWDMLTC